MKQIISVAAFLILILLFLPSCKKNSSPVNVDLQSESVEATKGYINGKWRLVKDVGGFGGETIYPKNTYWEFTNDNHFILTQNNIQQTDTCIWQKYVWGTDSLNLITMPNLLFAQLFPFQIKNDTLRMRDYCDDCYAHFLVR